MNGTKNNKNNENKKIAGEILKRFFSFIEEKINIMIKPKITKDKCLKKNVQSLVSSLSDTNKDVDTNEKNKPVINNKIIKENINLLIFFHHS